jgi:hypothetical protein
VFNASRLSEYVPFKKQVKMFSVMSETKISITEKDLRERERENGSVIS